MRIALVCGKRTEATISGANGICQGCGSEVFAKCGPIKENHWSHKGKRSCDPWWEPETPWHRSWKNHYPIDWQEVPHTDDKTGEKHIADILTNRGLVIECQHSFIKPDERYSRELIYKNMVWVVNGTRLKNDFPRLEKGIKNLHRTNRTGQYMIDYPEDCFPRPWLNSRVPVIFDFLGFETADDSNDLRNHLFCLYPKRSREANIHVFSHEQFITNTRDSDWFIHKSEPEPQQQTAEPLEQKKKPKRRSQSPYYYSHKYKRYRKRGRL